MTSKSCFKCGLLKPVGEFYAHPKMADGRLNKCKSCARSDVRENRMARLDKYQQYDIDRKALPHRIALRKSVVSGYRKSNPERSRANSAVARALKCGLLKRQPCWVCGEKAVAHHPDYSRPLDVVWLCQMHHKQAHAIASTKHAATGVSA